MNEIDSFFKGIGAKKEDASDILDNLIYICCCDFGWSQKDFMETDIPFLFQLLEVRAKVLKKQEEESKKQSRRR